MNPIDTLEALDEQAKLNRERLEYFTRRVKAMHAEGLPIATMARRMGCGANRISRALGKLGLSANSAAWSSV